MNLLGLRTAVERRTGVAYDQASLTEAVNDALQAIASEERWPWQQGTWTFAGIAGTSTYALGTTRGGVRSVTVDTVDVPRVAWGDIDADGATRGWTVYGANLVLSPVPAGGEAVQARVDLLEPALVADADVPLLPDQWHSQALVNLAASLVLERVGETDRADRRIKDYDRALKRMRHGARRARGPLAVRVRPGGGL